MRGLSFYDGKRSLSVVNTAGGWRHSLVLGLFLVSV